jgi:hypothetical protein
MANLCTDADLAERMKTFDGLVVLAAQSAPALNA